MLPQDAVPLRRSAASQAPRADSYNEPSRMDAQPKEAMVAVEMRPMPDPATFARMSTAELRAAFLIEDLFEPGKLKYFYSHADRAVIGAVVPGRETILLRSSRGLAAGCFTERRELGAINIGGAGLIDVGGQKISVAKKEVLYIGQGRRDIGFSSLDSENPAQFYFVSYPAHTSHPVAKAGKAQAEAAEMGSTAEANRRTIHKLIHPAGIRSCQLTMGFTELAGGSVWNTLPAHTHRRRSEIYLYFDLPEEGVVVHCMGEPRETRHIIVRNRQAVVAPSWSMHFGAGSTSYSFVWAMGGENQEFADMDMVAMNELR
jgi:4-deoxy-L-threo-5-hexosulose-uronate ketol-isomerase